MNSSKTTTTIVPLEATTVVDTPPTLASREYHPHHPPNKNGLNKQQQWSYSSYREEWSLFRDSSSHDCFVFLV